MSYEFFFAGSVHQQEVEKYIATSGYNKLLNYAEEFSAINKYLTYQSTGKLFVDSGAFTYLKSNKRPNINKYIQFINDNPSIYAFGQFDSIPPPNCSEDYYKICAKNTYENYFAMRNELNAPDKLLYTYHFGEPTEFLSEILNYTDELTGRKIPYIAVGGLVGRKKIDRERCLDAVYNTIVKSTNNNVKVHAFGVSDFELLEKYPISSSDSTIYIQKTVNNRILTNFGTFAVSTKTFNKQNIMFIPHLRDAIEDYIYRNYKKDVDLTLLANSKIDRYIYNIDFIQNLAIQCAKNQSKEINFNRKNKQLF